MLIVKLLLIRVSIHPRGDLSQVFLRNLSVELDVKEKENFGKLLYRVLEGKVR
jgi:hypothetical protein